MNTNNNSQSPCKVTSKYFSSSHAMDESLSDFKEKKKGITGPKNLQKAGGCKTKSRKSSKRIKGQKDIRTALKPKVNELLTYAKEFDVVCKESGIDIDSEQLQLAVALSKSLQTSECDNCDSESASSSSWKQRNGEIRKTLQQYGFTVPEFKVSKSTKRLKKCRKDYKLLTSTDSEKKQIIYDKYSQVLFENVNNVLTKEICNYANTSVFYLGTNVLYKVIQNNDILYVENLIEKSTSTGSLLRDWAEIPGRPSSPKVCQTSNMNFSEIECSQEELDTVLSGSLKSAKEIVRRKVEAMPMHSPVIVIDDVGHNDPSVIKSNLDLEQSSEDIKCINACRHNPRKDAKTGTEHKLFDFGKSGGITAKLNSSVSIDTPQVGSSITSCETIRSCSPDIFDDEESNILDSSRDNNGKIYQELIDDIIDSQSGCNKKKPEQNIVLDLTQDDPSNVKISCYSQTHAQTTSKTLLTNVKSNDIESVDFNTKNNKLMPHLSKSNNVTKRKSNDFMGITNCVGIVEKDQNTTNIDLTIGRLQNYTNIMSQGTEQTRRLSNDFMEITNCISSTSQQKTINIEVNIDLTQNFIKEKELETTVRVGDINNIIEKVNLSQSSNSLDELPFISVTGDNTSLDDTIIMHKNDISNALKTAVKVPKNGQDIDTEIMDLTQSPTSPVRHNTDKICNVSSQSFFDEFVHNHSEDTIGGVKDNIEKSVMSEDSSKISNPNAEVDLTQTSNSSDTTINEHAKSSYISDVLDRHCLGKKDDISIDYDDLFDEMVHNSNTNINSQSAVYNIDNEKSIFYEKVISEEMSQNSEVFEICDEELDYSTNKSINDAGWNNSDGVSEVVSNRNCEIDFRNASVVANFTMHQSITDSFLPMVDTRSNVAKFCETTPLRSFVEEHSAAVKTPGNNEYVIKTDHVTPMLDYGSMSTPERNKELDKYGLKPFKRKRAIQLLTHLYNQTHPVVGALSEDLPSPSKKRKPNLPSPEKIKGSVDCQPSTENQPTISNECNKENSNIYEVTNEMPDIRDIKSGEGDWVFQKREKAKVHSCRVPLHIAFHNFVSCRRRLREAILRYEPVHIDLIHKELVATGYRYDPKELLRFLDKKCITVRTTDNNARNNKK